jgi:hypothetical protein
VSAVQSLLNIVENKNKEIKLLTLKSELNHNMQLSSLFSETLNLSKQSQNRELEKWITSLNPKISSNINDFDNLLQLRNQLIIKKNEFSVTHITWEADVSEMKLNIDTTLKDLLSPIKTVSANGINCQLCVDTVVVDDAIKYGRISITSSFKYLFSYFCILYLGLYFRLLTNNSIEIDSTSCVLTLLSLDCEHNVIPFSCDFKHLSSQLWNNNSRFYAINKFIPSKEFILYINNDNSMKIIMTLSTKSLVTSTISEKLSTPKRQWPKHVPYSPKSLPPSSASPCQSSKLTTPPSTVNESGVKATPIRSVPKSTWLTTPISSKKESENVNKSTAEVESIAISLEKEMLSHNSINNYKL